MVVVVYLPFRAPRGDIERLIRRKRRAENRPRVDGVVGVHAHGVALRHVPHLQKDSQQP